MPINLKITWGSGASSARLMGLEDGTSLGDLKALIFSKSGIDVARYAETSARVIGTACVLAASARQQRL